MTPFNLKVKTQIAKEIVANENCNYSERVVTGVLVLYTGVHALTKILNV